MRQLKNLCACSIDLYFDDQRRFQFHLLFLININEPHTHTCGSLSLSYFCSVYQKFFYFIFFTLFIKIELIPNLKTF